MITRTRDVTIMKNRIVTQIEEEISQRVFVPFESLIAFISADYEWVIALNRVVLRLLGIWPERQKTTWKVSMTNIRVIVILNIMIWSSAVPALHSLIRIWSDITSVIDNLQYTLPLFISLMKFVLMWQKKEGTFH